MACFLTPIPKCFKDTVHFACLSTCAVMILAQGHARDTIGGFNNAYEEWPMSLQ